MIAAASGLGATTYGYNEKMCGDVGRAVNCDSNALTASGIPLGSPLPIVALSIPENRILRKQWFKARVITYVKGKPVRGLKCVWLLLADKKNVRFTRSKPWDLSKNALIRLGVKPSQLWGGALELCR